MSDRNYARCLLALLAEIIIASAFTGGYALGETLGTIVVMVMIASVMAK